MDSGRNMVFVSYNHKDGEWLVRLQVQLKQVEREGRIIP